MRLPCEYWIQALLSAEPPFPDASVQRAVSLRRYPVPELEYLAELREALVKTKPKPFDPNALHCVQWLKSNKIYDAVVHKADVKAAAALLALPQLRQKLEALLMGGVQIPVIQSVMKSLFGKELSETVIGYYRHYFWNTDLLSLDDWKAFLKGYPFGPQLWSIYVAADPATALITVGAPLQFKPEDMLQFMTDRAFTNFRTIAASNPVDRDTAGAAKLWADIALRGMELQEARKSSSDKALKLLEMLMLRFTEDAPISMAELESKGGRVIQMLPDRQKVKLNDPKAG